MEPPPTSNYTLSLHDALPISTIKLVLGLLKPDSGQILVDGEDVTNYSEVDMMHVRKKIGMIFQEGADRKSTRLNSSHRCISYAVFCLKKKQPSTRRDSKQ